MKAKLLLWPAIAAFTAGFAAIAIGRHRAFNTGRFDLGNMTQAIWNTAHGDFLQVTNLAGRQTSRLGSHFDPILAAFAPLWLAWPSTDMLVVVQAFAVALGALPVFWLARKHLGSQRAGLGFALAYLLYPATQWLVLNEFHPVAFACPLLLFAFWYLDEDRLLPFALFSLVAIACKEEIGLVVAGFGLWYLVSRRKRRAGAAIMAGGIAASVIAVEVVVPHFSGNASAFYSRYSEVGGTPGGVLKTLFTHPLTVLRNAFSGSDLDYLAHMLVPLGLSLRPLAVATPRSPPRGRPERPLQEPLPGVALLPLHGRADPAARRRQRARRGQPGAATPELEAVPGHRDRRARTALELLARRDADLGFGPRRQRLPEERDEDH